MDGFSATGYAVERYLVGHLLLATPTHIKNALLRTRSVCSGGQAMVHAGASTKQDRTLTLQSVGSKGPQAPAHAVYDRLQRWKFDMRRLWSLGVPHRTRRSI